MLTVWIGLVSSVLAKVNETSVFKQGYRYEIYEMYFVLLWEQVSKPACRVGVNGGNSNCQ